MTRPFFPAQTSNGLRGTPRRLNGRAARLALGGVSGLGLIAYVLFALFVRSEEWTGGSAPIALAMALGAVVTGGLGVALMGLAFYSSRRGFDDDNGAVAPSPSAELVPTARNAPREGRPV